MSRRNALRWIGHERDLHSISGFPGGRGIYECLPAAHGDVAQHPCEGNVIEAHFDGENGVDSNSFAALLGFTACRKSHGENNQIENGPQHVHRNRASMAGVPIQIARNRHAKRQQIQPDQPEKRSREDAVK